MVEDLDLFLWAESVPFQAHSATSIKAAENFKTKAPSVRQLVLDALESFGAAGATDEQLHRAVLLRRPKTKDSTVRARRCEATDDRLVADSGREVVGSSGERMTLWVRTRTDP